MAILQISTKDNVAIACEPLTAGVNLGGFAARNAIPVGHKAALVKIVRGEAVVKYGFPIGFAKEDILPGDHVHSHNLASGLGQDTELVYQPTAPPDVPVFDVPTSFEGFRRPNGRVGIRNEIWIVNTVGCVNVAAERIARAAERKFVFEGSGIDGVHAFAHPYGCSQLGDDLRHTQSILRSLVRHPNAAAVLVLGLGCENNQMCEFLAGIDPIDAERLLFFNAQEVRDEVAEGLQCVERLAEIARSFHRETLPVSELILGMKCGGSDAFSGLTANPLVGRVSDWLTAQGGTAILTEVPEMFGAEPILLNRAQDEATFTQAETMIDAFKQYFRSHGEPVDENPSPGNREGGITTLEEKSLGCVQKGGQATIRQIVPYGGQAKANLGGLALVNGPGNDAISSTALGAAGAQMVLFTTGRGTPLGVQAPTLKISSNSDLADRKPGWIDFDAGPALAGRSLDSLAEDLIRQILDVASGNLTTRNEDAGFREIAIWKSGVTL